MYWTICADHNGYGPGYSNIELGDALKTAKSAIESGRFERVVIERETIHGYITIWVNGKFIDV